MAEDGEGVNKRRNVTVKRLMAALFLGAILLVLLAGAAQTVFFPDEIAAGENRYANQMEPLTAAGYLDGSFQDSVEAALGDQVTFSATLKNIYQSLTSHSVRLLSKPFLSMDYFSDRYFQLGTSTIFGGTNLVYYMYPQSRTWRNAVLLAANLFVFKYFNFAVDTVRALTGVLSWGLRRRSCWPTVWGALRRPFTAEIRRCLAGPCTGSPRWRWSA